MKQVLLFVLSIGMSLSALAQVNTYYVSASGNDSNPGTSSGSPWLTFSHAAAGLSLGPGASSNCGLSYLPVQTNVGACVLVANGTYTSIGNIVRSGTSTQKIIWASTNQFGALLRGDSGAAVAVFGGNYVTVAGFDVSSSTSETYGLQTCVNGTPCHDRLVYGNKVHDLAGTCANSPGGAGIVSYDATTNYFIEANIVYNIDPTSGGGRWCHGVYIGGTNGTQNGHAYNNLLFNNTTGYGLDLRQDTSSTSNWFNISNNVIVGNGSTQSGSTACGLSCGGGITVDPSSGSNIYNITINNNTVYSNPGTGRGVGGTGNYTNSNMFKNVIFGNQAGNTPTQIGSGTTVSGSINSNPNMICGSSCISSNSDFHLTSSSPGIGTGTTGNCSTGGSPCIPTTDFSATNISNPPSIGAYNYGSTAPPAPTGLAATVQ